MADHVSDGKYALGEATYDFLKRFTTIYLPAAASAYFGLGQIWGFPAIEEVVGSVAVVVTFLGVVLGVSNASYKNSDKSKDGAINLDSSNEDNPIQKLDLGELTTSDLAKKDVVVLKVNDAASQ